MKTVVIVAFVILLKFAPNSSAQERPFYVKAYTSAAVEAALSGEWKLFEHLVESGADPNGPNADMHSLLVLACKYPSWSREVALAKVHSVKTLISRGGEVNRKDALGVLPLLAAERSGSAELVAVLKEKGAVAVEWKEPTTIAATVLVDAEHLFLCLELLSVVDGSKFSRSTISFEDVRTTANQPSLSVIKNGGKDIFGRAYKMSTNDGICLVEVNSATIADIEAVTPLKTGFWNSLNQKNR